MSGADDVGLLSPDRKRLPTLPSSWQSPTRSSTGSSAADREGLQGVAREVDEDNARLRRPERGGSPRETSSGFGGWSGSVQ